MIVILAGIKDTPRLGIVGFILVVLGVMMVWVVSYKISHVDNVTDDLINLGLYTCDRMTIPMPYKVLRE